MTRLHLQDLTKRFGAVEVLRAVSFSIESGERVAVVGESGSGKTTLLRIIAGLESLDAGRIRFDAQDITTTPTNKRGVSMVFQDYATYPRLSVAENLSVSIVGTGMSRADKDARLGEVTQWLGLSGLLKRLPTELSGGQLQRVALGKALMARPKVLLLDEPFSQLDVRLAEQMRSMLCECHRHYGMTQIMVTHHPLDVLTSVDKVAVLHRGQLSQFGTPDEIRRAPRTLFAAELTSPCGLNLLTGADGIGLQVAGSNNLAGEGSIVAVRPESIELASELANGSTAGAHISIDGRMQAVKDLGIVQLAQLNWGNTRIVMRWPREKALPDPGDKVVCVIKRTDLMTFSD